MRILSVLRAGPLEDYQASRNHGTVVPLGAVCIWRLRAIAPLRSSFMAPFKRNEPDEMLEIVSSRMLSGAKVVRSARNDGLCPPTAPKAIFSVLLCASGVLERAAMIAD